MSEFSDLLTLNIFSKFSIDEVSIFTKNMEFNTYSPADTIVGLNENVDFLGIVNKGEVEVNIVKNNKKVILGSLKIGEVFGEMSLFDNLSSSANVIAITECEILKIKKEKLTSLLENEEKIAIKFYRNLFSMLTQRLRATNSSLASHDYLLSQVRIKNTELEIMNLRLNQLTELNNKFLGLATSDISNPISTIMGLLAILSSGTLGNISDNQREIIKQIRDESVFIQNLIGDLINLGKIESGKTDINLEDVNLIDIVTNAFEVFKTIAYQKRINFVMKKPEINFPRVTADSIRIREVLNNIFSNALKYCAPYKTVETSFDKNDTEIIVNIKDQGPGMSESEIESIFNPFKTLDGKSNEQEKSIGLSLPISKKIIEFHRGRIWISSKIGEGTRLSFSIPFIQSESK